MTSNRIPSMPRDFRRQGLRDNGQYLTQLNNLFRSCGLFADRRYDGLLRSASCARTYRWARRCPISARA